MKISIYRLVHWVLVVLLAGPLVTGNVVFAQQVEDPVACPGDESVLDIAYGQHTTGCDIATPDDIDRFRFCPEVGDDVRFKVAALSNFMDPKLVVRDAGGAVVATEVCLNSCAYTLSYVVQSAGCHTLFLSDNSTLSTGDYSLQIERYLPADSEAQLLSYDDTLSDRIDPVTDTDFFRFYGVVGTEVRLNGSALNNFMDPTAEIRRPDGTLIVNGVADAATCNNSCSFSVDFIPDVEGWYSLVIFDLNTFAVGDYSVSLWCISGACDSDGNGTRDRVGPLLSYVTEVSDEIENNLDADFYRINATVGTEIRLSASAFNNFMDPTFEIRDPNNVVVFDGVADGAGCSNSCSFTIDFAPSLDGIHTLLIRDLTRFTPGSYDLSMWCISGPCDTDADGVVDGDVRVSIDTPTVLAYGVVSTDQIDPAIDADRFLFGGTDGDLIQVSVTSLNNFMDPTIEIRDPNNNLVIDGATDGASCNNSCSFSFEFSPDTSGTYSLLMRDLNGAASGSYTISVQCLLGSCTDAVAMCGDNCIDVPNGPLIPDAGGNSQIDTDGDGHGDFCDADFDQNYVVNFLDIAEWSDNFLTNNALYDINGNGIVNFIDLALVARMFLQDPGPSCSSPIEIPD